MNTTGTLAEINPIRYRGYYYDTDTGLYYLQSRYYDPTTCRFINADSYTSTGQGLLGNNMFAYCNNDPVCKYDPDGSCSRFLGFLWKVDCKKATCPYSGNYNPNAPTAIIIYDGRFSGYYGAFNDSGFAHQGEELTERLSSVFDVESHPYTTVEEFIDTWNGLNGAYDAVFVLGHGMKGQLRFKGNIAIGKQDSEYSYSELEAVEAKFIVLYVCHGATTDPYGGSTAGYLSAITGAPVCAIKDGKLSFTWYDCIPRPTEGARWCVTRYN